MKKGKPKRREEQVREIKNKHSTEQKRETTETGKEKIEKWRVNTEIKLEEQTWKEEQKCKKVILMLVVPLVVCARNSHVCPRSFFASSSRRFQSDI